MKFNEILRLPEKVPCDKRIHALGGVCISVVLLSILQLLVIPQLVLILTLSILLAISWGIELYQWKSKTGQYDNYDAIAVMLGGMIVVLPYIIKEVIR